MWLSPSGIDTVELMREYLPVSSARAFFDLFLADKAAFSILDGDLPPWNDHTNTSNGVLEPWSGAFRRMRFLAYLSFPIVGKRWIQVEQEHRYQFVTDPNDGIERLQITNHSDVRQTGGLPYADCFAMRQLWTVSPVPAKGPGLPTMCSLHIDGEIHWIGRPPFFAAVLRSRSFADHRAGTQGWLRGARACLALLAGSASSSTHSGDDDRSPSARKAQISGGMRKYSGRLALFMFFIILTFWLTCSLLEVDGTLMISAPSMMLSLRGMLAL